MNRAEREQKSRPISDDCGAWEWKTPAVDPIFPGRTPPARTDHFTNQEPFALRLTFSYDAVNNRTLVQDSLGGVLTSVFDSLNRLSSRQFGGTSQTPLRMDLTYTAQDYVATQTRYSDLAGTNKIGSTTMVL